LSRWILDSEPGDDTLSKPRVFISHVNNDPKVEEIWQALRARLVDFFDVLVDREILKPGDLWRNEIYAWIGLCDAAVILISRPALEAPSRVWVARETACLIFRRALDSDLTIIPVLLDDVTFDELEKNDRFCDLELNETQCVTGADIDKIIRALAHLRAPKAPLSKVAGQISGFLAEWHSGQIEAVLRECDVDLGHWDYRHDPYRRLALCLLTMDLAREPGKLPQLLGLLYSFKSSLMDQENLRAHVKKIANLLLPGLFEIEAVRGIVEESLKSSGDSSRRALWINAPDEDVAEHYAARAFPGAQPKWKMLRLPNVYGEDAKEQLISDIERVIEQEVTIKNRPRQARTGRSEVEQKLKRCNELVNEGKPVFITVVFDKGDELFVNHNVLVIKSKFNFATVLVLSDIDAELEDKLDNKFVRPLTPKLSKKDYDLYYSISDDIEDSLREKSTRAVII
jgi:hypothetical protein